MKLIAKRPCSFGGENFCIGDVIPNAYVLYPKEQEKFGTLTIVNDEEKAVSVASGYTIKTEAGELTVSPADMQSVFDVLLGKAGEVENIINTMEGDALILLHQAETRKAVKTAIEARAKALEGGEQ